VKIMKYLTFLVCLLPVSAESLRYSINWASGLSLGEATLRADKGKEAWDFEVTMDASIPGFALRETLDGVLALPDLAGAVAEARAAALPDPRQAALKRKIAEIRARVPASSNAA